MRPTREEVRSLFLFEGLTDEQLDWLAERAEMLTYDAGAVLSREGDPATHLLVLVEGGVRLSRLANGEEMVINETTHRGAYGGAVRSYVDGDETYIGSMTATQPSRVLALPAADFRELMRRWFPMAVHLLDGLYVGVRNSEAQVRQREHLASLGTLSANLAHELNNPAAAAVRATSQLRTRVAGMRHKLGLLASGSIPTASRMATASVSAAPTPPRSVHNASSCRPTGGTSAVCSARMKSYPVVPCAGQLPGRASSRARIFSTSSHAPGAAADSRSRYPSGSASPSGWSIRNPSTTPRACRSTSTADVASKTSSSSTRTAISSSTSKNRRYVRADALSRQSASRQC